MDQCHRWFHSGDALACHSVGRSRAEALSGLGPRIPKIWDRCPVCGRLVAQNPGWTAQLVYDDGLALFFDGAKDLLTFLVSKQWSDSERDLVPLRRIYVTSFYGSEVIDARDAFFVTGSRVLGPTGPDLVAHRSIREALEFLQIYRGKSVIGFDRLEAGLCDLTRGGWT